MSELLASKTLQSEEQDRTGGVAADDRGNEPPLARAWFRAMRAIMFEETPQPELDSLPLAQLRLLWTIRFAGNATMKDYSERLGVSQSTVTQLADRLVRRGLVERRNDASDRRVIRLRISDVGAAIMAQDTERQHRTFKAVWDAIRNEDRSAVMRGLDRLSEAAEAMRAAQGKDLSAFPWRSEADAETPEPTPDGTQPVVDLMARRVRGRRSE